MLATLNQILNYALEEIQKTKNTKELENLKIKYLGRKSQLTNILRNIKDLPPEEKPVIGKEANLVRKKIENALKEKLQNISHFEPQPKIVASFDYTLPSIYPKLGSEHPLKIITNQIIDIFYSMGFSVEEGPEIESDYYNFEGLNIPANHPARDEWDSFYITDNLLLRTHTSPVQLRVMEKQKPPLRFIVPGRCFRRDAVDRTHSHTFHQVEGFLVEENISFTHLKGILNLFAKEMFGEKVKMRFRPDFFPFTEPSADGSISCVSCDGKGCAVCSHSGWLEIFGCGMIHPKVLQNANIDSEKYTGFAFGMGIERIAMLKYKIDDIRLFLENDLRFLQQF